MVSYVKYALSVQKPAMNFAKVKHMLMMTPLVNLHGEKHKKTIDRKHALHSMVRKGNIKAKITTGAKKSEIQKRQYNRRVISKFIKTIYFVCT